ncbi:MAG: hypothetical protein IPO68_16530 [Chitinophagaceae bacterium]|nr:hypothetical protein [Chitinophagaceae bacterium]
MTWAPTNLTPGVAFIEMKDGTKMPDQNQRDRLNLYTRQGHLCGVFRQEKSVMDFLRRHGAPFWGGGGMNAQETLFTPDEVADLKLWSANILAPLRGEAQGYAKALTFAQASALHKLGLKPGPIIESGLVGVSQIEIAANETWSPSDHGPYYLTIAVNEAEAVTDIVAFAPDKPNEWFLRRGSAWALGMDHINGALAWPDTVVSLSATPLDWLRADMWGACVLDWTTDAIDTIRALQEIEVSSPKFAAALRLQLSKPPRLPEIAVSGDKKNAA